MARPRRVETPPANRRPPSAGGYTAVIIGTERGVVHYSVFDPDGGYCGYLRRGSAAWVGWTELEHGCAVPKATAVKNALDGIEFLSRIIQDGRARAWFEFQHARPPVPFGRQEPLAV